MSQQKLRICLVEDDDLIRDAATYGLKDRGYDIVVARNGVEAMAVILREAPDVIVTDVIMPESDAFQFLPQLRASFPHLPVVAVSGGGQTGTELYLDIARRLGANECLTKPFTIDALTAAIERAFRRNAE